jgi:hypothetical protein
MLDPSTPVTANDRQAAINFTVEQFTALWKEFDHTKDELPSFDETTDKLLRQYLVVMTDLIVGNLQWSLACKRYGHSEVSAAAGREWGDVIFDMELEPL